MNALTPSRSQKAVMVAEPTQQLVSFKVDSQLFGISALKVRDVLLQQPLTRVPLSRPEVAGTINLRGHIVTAISLRARLGVPAAAEGARQMCIVVESGGEQFCLIVDAVGDVISIKTADLEPNPGSLAPSWAQLSLGVCRLEGGLLLLLNDENLLNW